MRNHLTEEKIIDFVNGSLKTEAEIIVIRHLNECESCHKLYQFWEDTLKADVDVPIEQKSNLWNSLHGKLLSKKKLSQNQLIALKGFMIACACALFFIFGMQLGAKKGIQEAENDAESFMMDNQTVVYDLVHTSSGANKGYAWYNPEQKEVVLYINDNYPQNNYSYHAIIETKYSVINKQPIQLSNGKAQLYIQDDDLDDLNRIILTNDRDSTDTNSYEFHVVPNMQFFMEIN